MTIWLDIWIQWKSLSLSLTLTLTLSHSSRTLWWLWWSVLCLLLSQVLSLFLFFSFSLSHFLNVKAKPCLCLWRNARWLLISIVRGRPKKNLEKSLSLINKEKTMPQQTCLCGNKIFVSYMSKGWHILKKVPVWKQ